MTQEYSSYELEALQQLAGFRYIFYADTVKSKKLKDRDVVLQKSIDSFIEIFCQNNFADTDYSIIQSRPREFESADHWINQINIDTVLKCLTYIIWNNKIDEGYFLKKINDKLLEKHLIRLEKILAESSGQILINSKQMIAVNAAV